MMDTTKFVTDVETCVDRIIETVGQKIVFGMPLALGKPNHLANALYRRAKKNPGINLTLLTALSLEKPVPSSDLEARLMSPIVKRIWDGFVEFDYMKDLRYNRLAGALKGLKNRIKTRRVKTVLGIAAQLIKKPDQQLLPFLHRMRLDMPKCMKKKLLRAAVAGLFAHLQKLTEDLCKQQRSRVPLTLD